MSDNPYNRRKKSGTDRGRVSENKTAKRMSGRLTPASGAMTGHKGDITLDDYLLENKATVNASMSLKHEWLVKISHEAVSKGKKAGLSIQFVDDSGKPLRNGAWVMISEADYLEMTGGEE